jgi:hypothetical protein
MILCRPLKRAPDLGGSALPRLKAGATVLKPAFAGRKTTPPRRKRALSERRESSRRLTADRHRPSSRSHISLCYFSHSMILEQDR